MDDKVLVDTSVWISFFRNSHQSTSNKLKLLLRNGSPLYAGLIATELIRGAKSKTELEVLDELLSSIGYLETQESYYRLAGELGRSLATKGITIGTVDLLIAQIALENDVFLFSLDAHFVEIARHTALRLY